MFRNVFYLGLVVFLLIGCDYKLPIADYVLRVEVAPGKWLPVERQGGRAWFRCEWKGETVFWAGDYRAGGGGHRTRYDHELAVCLRSWNEDLYLITESSDPKSGQAKYTYWMLKSTDSRFEEIPRESFPKKIATQNLLMIPRNPRVDLDLWEVTRKLDYKNPFFFHTRTAGIWVDLEEGRPIGDVVSIKTREQRAEYFEKYVKKYQPIALPAILIEEDYKDLSP